MKKVILQLNITLRLSATIKYLSALNVYFWEGLTMKVSIKKFHVEMEIKKSGIELEIKDNKGIHLGDCIITMTKLIWCEGRTTAKNGKKIEWKDFITYMNDRQ